MLLARLAVAACALLVMAGCGTGRPAEVASQPTTSTSVSAAAERSDYRASEPSRTSLGSGVVLTVSAPKPFTPTDTAYPSAVRAVAFEVTIDNGSAVAFRPATLSFAATVDGASTEQVIDSTQGYNGTSGASGEVSPGKALRVSVAFAVPERPCQTQLSVRPDAASATPIVLYDGMV